MKTNFTYKRLSLIRFSYCLVFLFACLVVKGFGQSIPMDSVYMPANHMLLFKDTVIFSHTDTVVCLPTEQDYKIKFNLDLKSAQFYDSLYVKANNKRWKQELYNALVTYRKTYNEGGNEKPEEVFFPFEGLVINNISITQVDVLAGNVNDTSISADDYIEKVLHATHIYTREKILRKNLIINKGDRIDANGFADAERVIRSLNFIEDAKIIVVKKDDQLADVMIVVKDNFPIGVGFGFSSIQQFNIDLQHRNILGMGQELRYRAIYNAKGRPAVGSQLDYTLSNVAKSKIEFGMLVRETPFNTNFTSSLHKRYLSPETKYAGGLKFQYLRDNFALGYEDTVTVNNFNENIQNVWLGRSIIMSKEKRINLVLSAKYYRSYFLDRPVVTKDTNQYFQNTDLILANVILIKNRNIKTRYIKYLGRTEDIHAGYLVSLTTGYAWTDIGNRGYGGVRVGLGLALKQGGYLGFRTEYGSFFNNGKAGVGVFEFKGIGFSPLMDLGSAHLRIGGTLLYKNGINRYDYEWTHLGDEIDGLTADVTRGKSKSVVSVEAVYFSKFKHYGFRFAPYFSADLGVVRSNNPVFYEGSMYLGLGAGIRIRNESLVFKTLELGFIFYPYSPWGPNKYKFTYAANEEDVIDNLVIDEPYVVKF